MFIDKNILTQTSPEPTTSDYLESKTLSFRGAQLAEDGKLEEALEEMNKAIAAAPERAAAYNDRAQLLRLMRRDDGTNI